MVTFCVEYRSDLTQNLVLSMSKFQIGWLCMERDKFIKIPILKEYQKAAAGIRINRITKYKKLHCMVQPCECCSDLDTNDPYCTVGKGDSVTSIYC